MSLHNMSSLSQVMNVLAKRGISASLSLTADGLKLMHPEGDFPYPPELLEIIKTYRFEGNSDPADESALFHIRTADGKEGIALINYGPQASEDNEKLGEFLTHVPVLE